MLFSILMLAVRSIRRNMLRSFLTVLGIVIGVSAVITMVTLGNGATRAIEMQITSLGTNLLMISPGQRTGGGPGEEAVAACPSSRRPTLKQSGRRLAAWPQWPRRAAPALLSSRTGATG